MQAEPFGRYTLLQRLGSGGMAEVFLARSVSVAGFEKLLAIKRLQPFCTQDHEIVDLLIDEARITVNLTHPNIVQVFDFGRVEDSYYIAMEYVDGLDLRSLVREDDDTTSAPMPLDVSLYTVSCVLDALDFAHARKDEAGTPMGIIHRDVSPHNILISRDGQVKLADFGVARAAISIHVSQVGDIKGKFSFMPPEQIVGGEIDHRVDIFAAGAILYEMLSGHQTYRSSSFSEHLSRLRFEVEAPSKFRPDLPLEVDAVCLKALERDPARRYASAGEMSRVLRGLLQRYCTITRSPAAMLAELVEARLSQQRTARDKSSGMMSLMDYGLPDNSLIADELTVLQSRLRSHRSSVQELDSSEMSPKQLRKIASLKTVMLGPHGRPADPDRTEPPVFADADCSDQITRISSSPERLAPQPISGDQRLLVAEVTPPAEADELAQTRAIHRNDLFAAAQASKAAAAPRARSNTEQEVTPVRSREVPSERRRPAREDKTPLERRATEAWLATSASEAATSNASPHSATEDRSAADPAKQAKQAGKPAAKPAAKQAPKPAAKQAPKPAAKQAPKPAAKQAPKPQLPQAQPASRGKTINTLVVVGVLVLSAALGFLVALLLYR